MIEEIASVLVHSSPSDYLLLSGSSVIAGLCQSMWLSMHPICNTLLYDRTDGGNYVLRVIARSQLELTLERFKDAEEIRAREFRAKR